MARRAGDGNLQLCSDGYTIRSDKATGGHVLRKLAVLVLFSLMGLVAGVEASWYGQHYHPGWFGLLGGYRYYFAEAVRLSPGSDADLLVREMRGKHPGVLVVISPRRFRGPRRIEISGTGGIDEWQAVTKVGREIIALNGGRGERLVYVGGAGSELAGNTLEYGLLAGVGTALGIVVPSRRRAAA